MSKTGYFIDSLPAGHPDPQGDVTLLLHSKIQADNKRVKTAKSSSKSTKIPPQTRSLRVSSKTLSLASPVFTAMLSPKFMTNKGLSVIDPPEIDLPDDHLEAVALLCFALHYHDLSSANDVRGMLPSFAKICDKYDCAVAVQSSTQMWLQPLVEPDVGDHVRHWNLLWMSYALKNDVAFWKASQVLIHGADLEMPSIGIAGLDAVGLAILPPSLSGHI